MVVKYVDGDRNLITEANEEVVMGYTRRTIVNGYPSGCKEGDHVLVFTHDNVERIFTYFNDKLVETLKESIATKEKLIKNMEDFSNYTKKLKDRVDELEEDNQKLRTLNNELTLKLVELKV